MAPLVRVAVGVEVVVHVGSMVIGYAAPDESTTIRGPAPPIAKCEERTRPVASIVRRPA